MLKDILEPKLKRYGELEKLVSDPKIIADNLTYQKLARELSILKAMIDKYKDYQSTEKELNEVKAILESKGHDDEFLDLAKRESLELETRLKEIQRALEELLLEEEDSDINKNIIVEIRAGTGGLEASLFAADLFRMYSKYATKQNWKIEPLSTSITEKGGFKEIIFSMQGKNVYGKMLYESGTHRVQRVPETESSGRIHTSAVTVAVLPEADEVDLVVDPKDLRIDTFCSSGHGGQSVNTTYSAVRITHMPTGLVVSCQDERSQLKNRLKAMKVLRARLYEKIKNEQMDKIAKDRKSQVGSGDRSEKIRTYNFPDNRVTDHRINLTLFKIESIMAGDLDEFFDALKAADRKLKLEAKKLA